MQNHSKRRWHESLIMFFVKAMLLFFVSLELKDPPAREDEVPPILISDE